MWYIQMFDIFDNCPCTLAETLISKFRAIIELMLHIGQNRRHLRMRICRAETTFYRGSGKEKWPKEAHFEGGSK